MLDNLLDPVILCFVVGIIAGLLKSDLEVPKPIYEGLSLYLLLTIGLKGGVELAKSNLIEAFLPTLAAITLGISIPCISYFVLRKLGKINRMDSASIAAHYGSVSAVTFAVVLTYLHRLNVPHESFVTVLLVILEIPAIAVGILFARLKGAKDDVENGEEKRPIEWRPLLHEVFFGKSIYLLVAGLVIGYGAGPERIAPVAPLFFDLFKGMLAVFLLEMGLITSKRVGDLKSTGLFLIAFGILMPVVNGALGVSLGYLSGLSMGGATVLATLAASASYIAAPAAMQMALPKANPTLSLTASLAITFPFNIVLGIPLYFWMAQHLFA